MLKQSSKFFFLHPSRHLIQAIRTTALIGLFLAPSLLLGEKVALVIGINSYVHSNPLSNASNDAADMARKLQGGGYRVTQTIDATHQQFTDGITKIGKEGASAEVCLFFFAGHGLEVAGENYLVPSDGYLDDEGDLRRSMIPLSTVLSAMRQTQAKRKIIILDCCRNNPFRDSTRRGGLGAVPDSSLPPRTLIVYSGAPGQTVPDGEGRNSPFSEELLRQLEPGRDILSIFTSVAAERFRDQDPWIKFEGPMDFLADLGKYHLLSNNPGTKPVTPAAEKLKIASYWNHNGSTMGLLVRGTERIMIYVDVRKGLSGLVEPGMVLFSGNTLDGKYIGKARRFSKGLPPIEYNVEGPILDNGGRVLMRGKAPIRNADGTVNRVIDDQLEFSYLRLGQ